MSDLLLFALEGSKSLIQPNINTESSYRFQVLSYWFTQLTVYLTIVWDQRMC